MKDVELEINQLVDQMSLDEKIGLVHGDGLFRNKGIERLEISPMIFSDGTMGVRNDFQNDKWIPIDNNDDYVTYLPSNSALASTWNINLAEEVGCILGEEARGRGKDVILAPGINIKRSPLCGRNFEYLSEDPVITSEMAVALIEGIQKNDVAACVKHFVVNNQETNRLHVDTEVDETTLQEIYFPAFKEAVQRAHVQSVMGAYNKLNGTYCCENSKLLNEILRDQWGFDGIVISDWGAVHNTNAAGTAGIDIEMSVFDNFDQYCMAEPLKLAIKEKKLALNYLDVKVKNILRVMFRIKMLGDDKGKRKKGAYNTEEHRRIVKTAANESIILLKNDVNSLPLKNLKGKKVAVIGCNARAIHSNGGGSAEIKSLYEISPLMGLKMEFGGNTEITYHQGYYIPPKPEVKGENWQATSVENKEMIQQKIRLMREEKKRLKEEMFFGPITELDRKYHKEAIELANKSDIVIFIGGMNHDFDIEGEDRPSMKLPYHQDELIEQLLEVRPDTVVVLISGAPVEMPWVKKANAIVWSYYAGMESGTALAGVISGRINPSGKLAETFPEKYEDTPTGNNLEFGKNSSVSYKERGLVGYRYFEKKNITPLFCFGYGKSYTKFNYSNLEINQINGSEGGMVNITLDIENIGKVAGREIVQVYIENMGTDFSDYGKQLKAFQSIELKPGQNKKIMIKLNNRAFSFYNTKKKEFNIVRDTYNIYIGSSIKDIRLQKEIRLI